LAGPAGPARFLVTSQEGGAAALEVSYMVWYDSQPGSQ